MKTTDPDDALLLAQAARSNGDFAAALEMLREISRKSPNSVAVLLLLSETFKELGKMEEALTTAQKVICLAPRSEIASRLLFHCFWDMGNEEGAFAEITRFLAISDSKDYRAIIQELSEKRGNKDRP